MPVATTTVTHNHESTWWSSQSQKGRGGLEVFSANILGGMHGPNDMEHIFANNIIVEQGLQAYANSHINMRKSTPICEKSGKYAK